VDFVREVDELLKEVRAVEDKNKQQIGFDPESVAYMLKQQEKMQTMRQVESLLDLASSLKWWGLSTIEQLNNYAVCLEARRHWLDIYTQQLEGVSVFS
jgi:hypothetical protein